MRAGGQEREEEKERIEGKRRRERGKRGRRAVEVMARLLEIIMCGNIIL